MRTSTSLLTVTGSHRSRGYTLIEIMVALSVSAILLGVGVPSFRDFLTNQSIRTASFNLSTDLMLARSEAIKRNNAVVVTPNASDWAKGWVVRAVGTAEQLRGSQPTAFSVTATSGAPASITFDPSGRVANVNGAVKIGLKVETGSRTIDRCISLDPSGMPKVIAVACS